jgi:hypothetical protein
MFRRTASFFVLALSLAQATSLYAQDTSGQICSANDVEGAYASSYGEIQCSAGASGLSCCYSSSCRYSLELTIDSAGKKAAGEWDHNDARRSGPAEFGLSDSCELTSGWWSEDPGSRQFAWNISGKNDDDTAVSQPANSACTSNDQCASGTYCANDGICHPDSHLPIAQQACTSSGGIQPFSTNEDGMTLEELQASSQEQLLDGNTLAYNSEEERLLAEAQRDLRNCQAELDQKTAQLASLNGDGTAANDQSTSGSALAGDEEYTGGYMPDVDDRVWGGVSGFSGTGSHEVDLRNRFLGQITWAERLDRPCRIRVDDTNGFSNADYETWESCDNFGDRRSVPANEYLFRQLRVCHNDRDDNRLKGIQVWRGGFNQDGQSVSLPDSESAVHSNCRRWADHSSQCPSGYMATGLQVFTKRNSNGAEWITGLELICRGIIRDQ